MKPGQAPEIAIVGRSGSHLLVCSAGRFAVVERRGRAVYPVRGAARQGHPDNAEGIRAAVAGDWSDEATAQGRFAALASRGRSLARRLW